MIARSFKPVGWVAAVGVAALGCYMLSLRVAAERADLTRLDQRIVAAAQQIRSLQTELGTRGRMQQLEQWNDEVLALSAPVSGQFVENDVSLARFDTSQAQVAERAAEVRLASADAAPPAPVVAAPAAPAPAQPLLVRRASLTVPAATQTTTPTTPTTKRPAPGAAPAPAIAPTATANRAATTPARTAAASARTGNMPVRTVATPVRTAAAPTRVPQAPVRTAATPTRTVAAAEERPRPAAQNGRQRPSALLDDRTMRDLGAAARSERGGGARN